MTEAHNRQINQRLEDKDQIQDKKAEVIAVHQTTSASKTKAGPK